MNSNELEVLIHVPNAFRKKPGAFFNRHTLTVLKGFVLTRVELTFWWNNWEIHHTKSERMETRNEPCWRAWNGVTSVELHYWDVANIRQAWESLRCLINWIEVLSRFD